MPKKNLDEAIIRRIEAEKRAVRDAAEAFIQAKAAFDKAQGLPDNNTWAQSTEGQGFIAATNAATNGKTATPSASTLAGVRNFFLGNPEKNIYERTARSEFSYGERLSSYLLPKAFGGLDGETTRNLQRAQAELKAAQITLHNSMDAEFGTRTNRLANGDTSFAEAAKTIAGGFGAVKGFGRILGGLGSIVLGGADDRFGEVHIKNGGLVRTKPRDDDRPSLFGGFLKDQNSYVCGGGLRGLIVTPFVFLGQLTGIGHKFAPFSAFATLGKGVESALYLAGDIALTIGKAVYLPFNMAANVVKAGALLAYGGVLAVGTGISAVRGLFREAADFSLKSHVDDRDLDNATDLVLNSLKHADINQEIGKDDQAKAARDEAREAKAKEIDAVNKRSGATRSPQQKIEINAAGREAGEAVLNSRKSSEEGPVNDSSKKDLSEFEQVSQKINETVSMQEKLEILKSKYPTKNFSKQENLLENHLATLQAEHNRLSPEQPVAEGYDQNDVVDYDDDMSDVTGSDYADRNLEEADVPAAPNVARDTDPSSLTAANLTAHNQTAPVMSDEELIQQINDNPEANVVAVTEYEASINRGETAEQASRFALIAGKASLDNQANVEIAPMPNSSSQTSAQDNFVSALDDMSTSGNGTGSQHSGLSVADENDEDHSSSMRHQ